MTSRAASLFHRLGGGALCLAGFLLGFVSACTLLVRLTPMPPLMLLSKKIDFYEKSHQQDEVVFLGSSRVYRQIDCHQFDAVAAAAGRPVHSYNFGQDGTWPPESLYVLRELLKRPMPKLKWIFIELMSFDARLREDAEDSEQFTYWHDRHYTNLVESEMLQQNPWKTALPMLARTERVWLRKASGYGAGAPLLKETLFADRTARPETVITDLAGFHEGRHDELTGAAREQFLQGFKSVRSALVQQNAQLTPALRADLHELIGACRRRGVEPVFFIPPGNYPWYNFADVPDGATLISLSRPDRYPELFQPEIYYDAMHLNPKGAAIFTELLAKKFVELVPDRP